MSELFFSKRLRAKMDGIKKSGLTIVEAPAGYGKTTVVREALAACRQVRWYNAIKEVTEGSFGWFLAQLERADIAGAAAIRSLGVPSDETKEEIAKILFEMEVKRELYIVLDNFQYIIKEWHPQFIAALSRRKRDGLHVICIAQHMGSFHRIFFETNKNLCTIYKEELLLNREEIQGLARKKGLELSPARITMIFEKTDGWAVAVGTYLRNIVKYGEQVFMAGNMNELLHDLFWKKLTEEEKEILLRLSPYDRFNFRYIDELLPGGSMSREQLQQLFERVPLLDYYETKQQYIPHQTLLSFVRFQLVVAQEGFHHKVCREAGQVYQNHRLKRRAVEAYYKAEDYAGILSCDLSGLFMEEFAGNSYRKIAHNVLEACMKYEWKASALNVLRMCYGLYALADFEAYEKYITWAGVVAEQSGNKQLIGEYLMVSAFRQFPDVKGMCEIYRQAEEYMHRPSEIFTKGEPFMFGCTTMLYLFYHECGRMLEIADELDEMMKVYNRLTNGHGAGAAELYRAEAYSAQGAFEESDILVHKAQLMAENAGNISVVYGTAQLCAINALYQTNMKEIEHTLEYVEKKRTEFEAVYENRVNTYMTDTVRSYVFAMMMETELSAAWTRSDADSLLDLTFLNFPAKLCRVMDRILKKDYRKAIASMEATLLMDKRLLSLPALSMMYVGLVMCNMAIGRMNEAVRYLELLLELIGRDKNYVFVACYRKYIASMLTAPQFMEKYSDVISEIEQVSILYTRAEKSRLIDNFEPVGIEMEALTRREREVAQLAAQGLHNSEIAQRLHITENTVKGYMKTIFRKLGVDRRSYLADVLDKTP